MIKSINKFITNGTMIKSINKFISIKYIMKSLYFVHLRYLPNKGSINTPQKHSEILYEKIMLNDEINISQKLEANTENEKEGRV